MTAGDSAIAKAIRSCRRPTTAAWLVNLLVRERADQLDGLLDLGAALRQAQENLAGAELRQLARQRRQVIHALAREVHGLAREHDRTVSDSIEREIEQTLEAALVDPAAADAVRTGTLVRSLEPNGIDPVDLSGAVALSAPAASRPPKTDRSASGRAAERATRRQRAIEQAQRALEESRQLREETRRAAAEAEGRKKESARERQSADDELRRLEAELAAAGEASAAAKTADDEAGSRLESARRAVDSAERAFEQAAFRLREVSAD